VAADFHAVLLGESDQSIAGSEVVGIARRMNSRPLHHIFGLDEVELTGQHAAIVGFGAEWPVGDCAADEDMTATWTVTAIERKDRLDGWIVTVEGEATSVRGPLLSGKGTLLLRLGPAR